MLFQVRDDLIRLGWHARPYSLECLYGVRDTIWVSAGLFNRATICAAASDEFAHRARVNERISVGAGLHNLVRGDGNALQSFEDRLDGVRQIIHDSRGLCRLGQLVFEVGLQLIYIPRVIAKRARAVLDQCQAPFHQHLLLDTFEKRGTLCEFCEYRRPAV